MAGLTSPIKFLGAYVVNISCQVGWGGDNSSCSMTLAEDPDNGVTFSPPKLGTACMIKVGGFSFGGIFQRYMFKESVDGGRLYDITLESPSKVLDGVFVVLDKWQGTIYTDDSNVDTPYAKKTMTYGGSFPTNLINVFAMKENYSYGGHFGKADVTEMGYPVKGIVADIKAAMGAKSSFGGKIYYGQSEFDLDLSELDKIIAQIPDYRINADLIDMNSLIKNIMEIGLGYYLVKLEGTADGNGIIQSGAKIVLKAELLKSDPSPGIIKQTITTALAAKTVSSYSVGKELSDGVSQKVLLGAAAGRYWLADQRYIFPIWGQLGVGENTKYFYGNSLLDYADPFTKIKITVDGGYEGNFTTVDTDLLEIRCAGSSRQTWTIYHLFKAIKEGKIPLMIGNVNFKMKQYEKLLLGELGPNDLMNTNLSNAEVLASYLYGNWQDVQETHLQRVVNARYKTVLQAHEEFYGKKFLVATPLENGGKINNYRWIEQDRREEFSWNLTEASWGGEELKKRIADKKFYDSSGKLQCLAVSKNFKNADYSSLGSDYSYYSYDGNPNLGVISRVNVNPDGFNQKLIDSNFMDTTGKLWKDSAGKDIPPATSSANQLSFACVAVQNVIPLFDEITTMYNGFNILAKLILKVSALSYHNMYGFNAVDCEIGPAPLIPSLIGIPQTSQRYLWGPWYSVAKDNGSHGKLHVETDPLFAPENFGGSIKDMNDQAKTYVNSELAQLYESEAGHLEIAELPTYNLADRFAGSGPYVTGMNIQINTGGFVTTYQFASWTRRGANLARYNANRISHNQRRSFEYLKKIRDLYRNPIPKPIDKNLFGAMEKRYKNTWQRNNNSTQGIFGNYMNAAARAINGYDITTGSFPSMNVQGMPIQNAMEGLGLNYKESFGNTMEQQYNGMFLYNQRNKDGAIQEFNT
jgi:hypothetical protein